ncbi:2-hydroxy-3-oxopropionate reductase [Siccirubricoccus deserti]|uniref:NAD(P)-dependent oxidoreductase n=1 Tax=Siccirubricoccus deserti TaxID=2013562 RepID=A0A9X0UF56_9PROT|nr:NAD(P)-dependent oxidoreductase [Siccirubricoccus deserti]MBC4017503.1 NAD(P)-dependent oxidoreductase [Siccirubricoccus deserti]GGC60160.1 2-hydroxy-3-oxopropionate reductase [Siccirubricoccus deserti]
MIVGFIGLGTMGASMASNLQKGGYKLVVNDIARQNAQRHIDAGAEWAATPKEVAERADVVFTSLPGPPEVESVIYGEDGLIAGAHPGMAYFDLSTNSQDLVRRIHDDMAPKGAAVFDAPVSGGPHGAASGKLAIWVGGDKALYEKLKPVLDSFGDKASYIGPIGSATVAKLVHNLSGYAIQTVMAETFTMGVKAGMDPIELWKAIREGALGRRRTFDRIADQYLINHYDPPAFALKLAYKDVSLAVGLGRKVGVPMRLCNLVQEEMSEALNRGWSHRDSRVTMLLQNERAGVTINCDRAKVKSVLDSDKG